MRRSIVDCDGVGGSCRGCLQEERAIGAKQEPRRRRRHSPRRTCPAEPDRAQTASAGAGVQAGGIQHEDSEGAAGIDSGANGTVEVRRVGETAWAAAKADTKLYPGDTVRTGESSTATVTLADESMIEVAEVSTIAVASRDGTADPASAAAVLGGIARFTVTPRAPGEGPFRVYTSSGVVLTKGTVYGVGVAASGEARVGVESGTVDVDRPRAARRDAGRGREEHAGR